MTGRTWTHPDVLGRWVAEGWAEAETDPARAGRRTTAKQSAAPLPLPRAKETKEERHLP